LSQLSAPLVLNRASARPGPYRGPFSELVRWLSAAFLKIGGWKIEGDWPAFEKVVLVAAPHTSNWDGINMLAAAGYYRVRLRWMGKRSLTQGPFGFVVRWLGCVPIDRSASNDVVQAMAAAFAAEERMVLAIPPEGTRSAVKEWKSGFYHVAVAAGVPIVLSVLDYGTRTARLAAVVFPSGDYESDLALIKNHYAKAVGKHPDKFTL
jgi:1-acyl-sn-glycerol-3-phosphate acyltransferase